MPTVLIVDDEKSILEITSAILSRHHFSVKTASSSQEARAILSQESVDIALVDVVMPGKGGLDLLMEIHEHQPGLPVLIMSGKVRTDLMPFTQLTRQFGAKGILTKPFSPDELVEAISGVLLTPKA